MAEIASDRRHARALIDRLDPLNFSTVRIVTWKDGIELGPATGFFIARLVEGKLNYWLVTNWHVLAGRNALDPARPLHSGGALPNRIEWKLALAPDHPEYNGHAAIFFMQTQSAQLYDDHGQALWFQHCDHRNSVDVAVFHLGPDIEKRFHIVAINDHAKQADMAVQIGGEVFILGYPLGFTHFAETPIWKRGTIASEPHLETGQTKFRVVIDATTRAGMSGAPVIIRAKTHYLSENGRVVEAPGATRWIGVYSSRPDLSARAGIVDGDGRAEVGFYYKPSWVEEIISRGISGPEWGALP